jgi:hypothetical protein
MLITRLKQYGEYSDNERAAFTMIRPILCGLLFALKSDVVSWFGEHKDVSLWQLARVYREGDGDCGICFEYAVHDAIQRNDPLVMERVLEALKMCRIPGHKIDSLLFGVEKQGAMQVIDNTKNVLTDDSRLLTGSRAQPAKLKKHIDMVAAAFRHPKERLKLPSSIYGLWKADLFIGDTDTDQWVAATVKMNRYNLEGASGLRIGFFPEKYGKEDKVHYDDRYNLIICPIPYKQSFMEVFYSSWTLVEGFIKSDADVPIDSKYFPYREILYYLAGKREWPVLKVVEDLKNFAYPNLLEAKFHEPIIDNINSSQVSNIQSIFTTV